MSLRSERLIRAVAVAVALPAAAASATDATLGGGEPTTSRPSEGRTSTGLAPLARVRVETVPPSNVRGQWVQERARFVQMQIEPAGEPFTLSKAGRTLDGRVASIDDDSLTLLVKGQTLRVRRSDVVRLQVPGERSPVLAIVGGLAGAYVGAWAAGLVVSATGLEGDEGLWLALGIVAASAGVGGAALGSSGWKTIPLPRDDRVSLALKPLRQGTAVGLSLRF